MTDQFLMNAASGFLFGHLSQYYLHFFDRKGGFREMTYENDLNRQEEYIWQ